MKVEIIALGIRTSSSIFVRTQDNNIISSRSLKSMLLSRKYDWTAALTPSFIRVPLSLMHFGSYKF